MTKKKMLTVLIMAYLLCIASTASAASPSGSLYSDVPAKHWSYNAVNQLAKDGIIEGYSDGKFLGDRIVTRYEMALIIANAITKMDEANAEDKALISKLSSEFARELKALGEKNLGERIDKLEAKQSPLKLTGEADFYWFKDSSNLPTYKPVSASNHFNYAVWHFLEWTVNDNTKFHFGAELGGDHPFGNTEGRIDMTSGYVELKGFAGTQQVLIGRQPFWGFGNGLFGRPSDCDGIRVDANLGSNLTFRGVALNINPPPNQTNSPLNTIPQQANPTMGTVELGTRISPAIGLKAGYYWSSVNGAYGTPDAATGLYDLYGTNGNYNIGSFEKSRGYDVATDFHFGSLMLLTEFTQADLVNRTSAAGDGGPLLPKHPKALGVELTTHQVPVYWPAVDGVFDKTKVGNQSYSLLFWTCDSGSIPYSLQGYSMQLLSNDVLPGGYDFMDNTNGVAFIFSDIIAKNVKLVTSVWRIKFRDMSVMKGYQNDPVNYLGVRLCFYY